LAQRRDKPGDAALAHVREALLSLAEYTSPGRALSRELPG
jgi:hypothetical protein